MDWDKLKQFKLVVYSTPWCGDCRRLKKIFERHGVGYEDLDIDATPSAAGELKSATGRGAIPYVRLENGAFVRGWHDESPAGFDERVFFQDVSAALSDAEGTASLYTQLG